MFLSKRILAIIAVMALIGSACGGAGDEGEGSGSTDGNEMETTQPSQQDSTTTQAGSTDPTTPPPPDQPEVTEMGSFTVNETEFPVTVLNRCIPFFDEEGNIDLQALGAGAKLNLEVLGGNVDVSVDGSQIQALFGSIAFGEDPFVYASVMTDGRWIGTATVGDSLGSGETVDVSWDVQVPDEARDCSL